jgi:transposase
MVRKAGGARRHTAEFKWEAVQLLHRRRAAGVSMQRVADELDVGIGLIRRWADAVARAPAGAPATQIFPGSGHSRSIRLAEAAPTEGVAESPEAELRRLRRENERLRQERDFLKKAAAFFAKESP